MVQLRVFDAVNVKHFLDTWLIFLNFYKKYISVTYETSVEYCSFESKTKTSPR
jgi:hypothetical protein